jgi:predicted transcriptional regulator
MTTQTRPELLRKLTAKVVAAYVGNNALSTTDLPTLITDVHQAFADLSKPEAVAKPPVPAANPKRSVTRDYIICLEDGKKFKSLKRHLMAHYGLTPEEYREKWGLAPDYPMVAPSYAETRSRLAREMGLGRKSKGKGGGKASEPTRMREAA